MNVVVYCGSSAGDSPRYVEVARELGTWIAEAGHSLVYGGSSVGLMGVVAGAALAGGAYVTGVEPRFFLEMGVEQHDLPELVEVETMSERKAKMVELGDAFVALPGGVGTLEEISEIMSRIRLRLSDVPCMLLNVDGYYDPLKTMLEHMVEHGFLADFEFAAIKFPRSVAEVAQLIGEA
ncbi:MAG: TIGR00730 family Rossman fold protein [Eggerthellaceae bacterium]|nr:TIGR00730 family Rossman fold protein [Eggerthellaceae bacterium]